MTRSLPTRAELEQRIIAARQHLLDCEDSGDAPGAEHARCRCDELLDQWQHLPEQREP